MFATDMQMQLQQIKLTAHMRPVMDGATNNKQLLTISSCYVHRTSLRQNLK